MSRRRRRRKRRGSKKEEEEEEESLLCQKHPQRIPEEPMHSPQLWPVCRTQYAELLLHVLNKHTELRTKNCPHAVSLLLTFSKPSHRQPPTAR